MVARLLWELDAAGSSPVTSTKNRGFDRKIEAAGETLRLFKNKEGKMRSKFDEDLLQLKYESGLCKEVDCSEEENKKYLELLKRKKALPIDIAQRQEMNGTKWDKFYKVVPMDISYEELQEYCLLKQTKNLNTIKKCVVFFTVLTAISLFVTVILLFSLFQL